MATIVNRAMSKAIWILFIVINISFVILIVCLEYLDCKKSANHGTLDKKCISLCEQVVDVHWADKHLTGLAALGGTHDTGMFHLVHQASGAVIANLVAALQ